MAPDSPLRVAVGVLRRADGRVLVAARDASRHAGGGLEFPGGKMEPGESPASALARELAEELGIVVRSARPLIRVRHRYPGRSVALAVDLVDDWAGEPAGREGQAVYWRRPDDLRAGAFPAANRPILACLRWPSLLRVASIPADGHDGADGVRGVAASAIRGNWVQLRRVDLDERAWRDFVHRVRAAVDDTAARRILVNTGPADPLPAECGFGLHLSAARAARLEARPPGIDLLSCSAHNAEELDAAARLDADFAIVGAVRPTPSHPGRAGMGWSAVAGLAAGTTLPVYAIGGLTPDDLATARDHGAVGVAGISAFRG